MAVQLLVRVYNVGLGDCIYVRVPDLEKNIHILIDCGNKFGSMTELERSINDLKVQLTENGTREPVLDLLVVTHPHEDHHKGFEKEFFQDIQIKNIWLSPAYNAADPNAIGYQAIQKTALTAIRSLADMSRGLIKQQLEKELLSLSKTEAYDMLRTTLPQMNGIQPLYVTSSTPENQLLPFDDPDIHLKVLSPHPDIDGYYTGNGILPVEPSDTGASLDNRYQYLLNPDDDNVLIQPQNISSQDFRRLRQGMQPSLAALAELSGEITNNLSVVLLLEWKGNRLLFTGDAQWNSSKLAPVQLHKTNGSWDVMWDQKRAELEKPVDFFKLSHHGSKNATPWTPPKASTGKPYAVSSILDALVPPVSTDQDRKCYAVASTERTSAWKSIPNPELLEELGKRIKNAYTYSEHTSAPHLNNTTPQPQRTDLDPTIHQENNEYIDFLFTA